MTQQSAERAPSPASEGPEPHRNGRRAAWSAIPAFRLVITGSSISMLGTKISTLAFPMLVLWLGGSPELAGLAVFVTIIPGVLLYFPAGIIVDKLNPWRVMIVSEITRGIVAIFVVVTLLQYGRHVNIRLLILAMLAEEALEMFTTLAERRYLNGLMGPAETEEQRSQQASVEARAHVAVLAGRPMAPSLFALGPLIPFLIDSVSFVFSVTGLLLSGRKWKPQEINPSADVAKSAGIADVLRTVRRHNTIWLGGTLMAMTSLVAQALILIFLTEAHSRQFSSAAIGVVLAASGLGGAIGSYWSTFVPKIVRQYWLPTQMTAWLATCLILALAGGHSAWWSACTMFIFSVTGAIGNVEFSTYLNKNIDNGMLGKISGIGYATSIGACALGPVIGGYSVQLFGVQGAVLILLCIVCLMTSCSFLLLPRPRDLPGFLARKSYRLAGMLTSELAVIRSRTGISPAYVAPLWAAYVAGLLILFKFPST